MQTCWGDMFASFQDDAGALEVAWACWEAEYPNRTEEQSVWFGICKPGKVQAELWFDSMPNPTYN